MKNSCVIQIFKSHYYKLIFVISLFLVSFLVPNKIFYGYYYLIEILFIILTSLTTTCFVRGIKEKAYSAKSNGASLVGILSIIFGFGVLQACVIGSPVCGATIGTGMVALIFPAFNFIKVCGILVIISSIFVQVLTLYSMNCFKSNYKKVKK
ncbi:MAG: hypothetical protein DRP06_04065 [Candidatus Aenigmatarchaeota archaeon]|nr:MAG: hypothetical protein DRP06_04065 [Candidatus Aenigmarchaeota archaeon]